MAVKGMDRIGISRRTSSQFHFDIVLELGQHPDTLGLGMWFKGKTVSGGCPH